MSAGLLARAAGSGWAVTDAERATVWARLTGPPLVERGARGRHPGAYGRGLGLLLDWLQAQPGATWQDRWLASGVDTAGRSWRRVPIAWLRERGHHARWHHDAFFKTLRLRSRRT